MKKMDDPLLLAANPPDTGAAFKHAASSPGGFGYDSAAKCEQKRGDAVLTLWPSLPVCLTTRTFVPQRKRERTVAA